MHLLKMRSKIVYFEFPYDVKEGIIRATVIIASLVAMSYFVNRKFYFIPNILLGVAMSTLYTDKLDETVLFSSLMGLVVYGYHFFRLYGPMCLESYKYSGQGVVMALLAGMVGYSSTYNYKS
jgi:hypothetical protein